MFFVRDKGQLCNNILQYAHVYAWCRENHRRCMSMRFAYKYKYFRICHLPWHNFFVYSLAKLFGKLRIIPVYDYSNQINTQPDLSQIHSPWAIVEGWTIRYYDLFLKYKRDILNLFAFDNTIISNTKDIICPHGYETNKDVVRIGLHVRRGDYKNFFGGRYYYDTQTYLDIIRRTIALFSGKELLVFICGNDVQVQKQIATELKQNDSNKAVNIVCPNGSPTEDLYVLSQCDYLVGPLSTFTVVATMYEKAKLLWIEEPQQEIDLREFKDFNYYFRRV